MGAEPHGPHSHAVHRHRDLQGGWARAGVFGVSDGLVSNVALVLGVAAASADSSAVLVAGVAGLLAGSTSMAAGEYVSMKAQAELVERELEIERRSIERQPGAETRELSAIYSQRGVSKEQADAMAEAVMADPEVALEVHAREELGIDPGDVGDPVAAAAASFVAFALGAIVPLLPWLVSDGRVATIGSAVLGIGASAAVGLVLSIFTERSKLRTASRQVSWAAGACLLTWLIGSLMGATVT